jgi:NAD(P)-dependent dehydrogenase (short-subunit alcohol dehydrogenase family)
MSNLSGKTALVTGASRGIGRASALGLAKAGAQVLVHYNGGEKDATAVVAEIREAGGKAEKLSADLRASDGPHALAERVVPSSAHVWTSSSPTPASPRAERSKRPLSRTSMRSSP